MGHKKRATAPRTKSTSSVVSPNGGAAELVVSGAIGGDKGLGDSLVNVKVECERALNALRRSNYTKAVRLIKDASHKFDRCGLVYRVQGTVCVKAASVIDDPNVKQRHLRNAVESARKAVELSPNSIEFAHFYANLLCDLANESTEYEEVVRQCENALQIDNPVDPAKESLQEESEQKISTAEGRISHVQAELRSLIQKANIASISNWMKYLNGGEEKFRLFTRAVEDPMELSLAHTKRANEIKKATKTPEERRKEIEVRVAAARLLQQQSDSPNFRNGGENRTIDLDSTSGTGNKVGERRKHGNSHKSSFSIERKDWVQTFWNTMSEDAKKDLLRVSVPDLKTHFASSKYGFASEILSQALSYAEVNKSWKLWTCCRCQENFADHDHHMRHVMQKHMGSLPPKLQSVMPQNVSDEWAAMILSCPWKPMDVSVAISKCKDHEPVDRFSQDDCPYENGFTSAWDDEPLNNQIFDGIYNVSACGDVNCLKLSSDGIGHCDGNQVDSDKPERAKLLGKIRSIFEALIQHKYLAVSHLSKVIQFTVDEIHGLPSGKHITQAGIDQSPECICFLGSSQLRNIVKYLQDISHSCSLGRYPEKSSLDFDEVNSNHRGVNVKEKLSLSGDGSLIQLNEGLISVDPTSVVSAAAPVSEVRNSSGLDGLLTWIYTGLAIEEQLTGWMQTREAKSHQEIEFIQSLDKEFNYLQGLCEKKCDNLGYEEALKMLEDLCLEESKRRDTGLDIIVQSYDSILKRRQTMLTQDEKDSGIVSNRFELDVIENITREVKSLMSNQCGYNRIYGAAASHIHDLESGLDDYFTSKDYINQMNNCVKEVIQRQKEQISLELSKLDARIMHTISEMRKLEIQLATVSVYDYENIILPLVKSFLKAHVENLAEKHATEKSDAVREALLAELALDSKKGNLGNDTRLNQTKDKKKGKDRRVKDTKIYSSHEQHIQDDDTTEPIEESIQWGEEFKRQVELEAEEKKLEETLEYQRRIENETKHKHNAEKKRQSVITPPQKLEEWPCYMLANGYQDSLYQNDDVLHAKETSFIQKMDGAPKTYEHTISNSQDTVTPQRLNVNSVTGRRGKGHKKSSKSTEGLDEPVSTDKGNAGFFASEGPATENVRSHDIFLSNEDIVDNESTLRQLHADDDEERFQADLEKAVRQSLDVYAAWNKIPLSPQVALTKPFQTADSSKSLTGGNVDNGSQVVILGTGLKNETGEYNCFLNVIIQSLWHIRRFRDEFLRKSASEHFHVGDPCVVCALHDIFTSISLASIDNQREAVAPTSLRSALSNLCPNSNFFQEGQMNDASEVLEVIFDCLHRSFKYQLGAPATEPNYINCVGSWDCLNKACIAHSIFGMNIFERMNCRSCQLESKHLKYTSFFHNINANALRTMKAEHADSSFDQLLNFVEMSHTVACDPEAGGCGENNYIHHILSSPPQVFTTVLGWQNTCETSENIKGTLAALSNAIDVGILYRDLDPRTKHFLVSVVCYYGQHYHCFAYSHDHEQWLMYDDHTVKMVGSWEEVLSMCERGHLQPQVLFYELKN